MRASSSVCLALATATILTACGSSSDDASGTAAGAEQNSEPTEVIVAVQPTGEYTPMHAAIDQDLFPGAGIEVDAVPVSGAGAAVTALSNGSVHIVSQAPTVAATANQQGSDLRLFCGSVPEQWNAVVAASGSTLPAASDGGWEEAVQGWQGRSVGVPTLNGAVHYWLQDLVEAAGMSSDDLEYIAVGVGPAASAALQTGTVDLLFTFPWQKQVLGDQVKTVFDYQQDAPEELRALQTAGWIATAEWLSENEAAANSFCDGVQSGIEYLQDEANADAAKALITENYGITDAGALERAVAADGPFSVLDTEIDCDNLTRGLDAAVKRGLVKAEPAQGCDTLLWDGAA